MSPDSARSEALDRFRAYVMADEALQMALARISEPEAFVAAAGDLAEGARIAFDADLVKAQLRPDPIGMFLHAPAPQTGRAWPGKDWLPIQIVGLPGDGFAVDWAHFAGASLEHPFFATDARRTAELPFNRLFRYRTGFDDFIFGAAGEPRSPDGLIFHMSRCGSTLVSQMLAALPGVEALSEPAPLDIPVKLAADDPDSARGLAGLRAMIAALGRRRSDRERQIIFKLDAWQTIHLPLFRRAFPDTPWLFLYRDPVEVLASLALMPSVQMMAHVPHHHGISAEAGDSAEDHIARIVARICESAADRAEDGGLFVNHGDLPQAIGAIMAHFGIVADEAGLAAIEEAARRDAKSPWRDYVADSQAKQRDAPPVVRAAADRHLAQIYDRLEALRRSDAIAAA